jgi:hypothetical protein
MIRTDRLKAELQTIFGPMIRTDRLKAELQTIFGPMIQPTA